MSKKEYNFNDFEAEQLNDINKVNKKIDHNVINIHKNTNNEISNSTPKYLQERTIFLMDNDNKVLFNAFIKEKQWSKSQALNHMIREFLKNQN